MGTAQQIIDAKDHKLATLGPEATVLQAAKLMNERHIGSLLVMAGEDLVGIFTERDVMRRVVAKQRDPATTKLASVMTKQVACASPRTSCDEVRQVMRDKRIRHMPVVDDETMDVIGMISIGDLNAHDTNSQEVTIQYLHEYIYGRS